MQRTSTARGYILFHENTLSVFVDGMHTNASPIIPHMCAFHQQGVNGKHVSKKHHRNSISTYSLAIANIVMHCKIFSQN
jgi:hypothetical protein